MDLAARNDSAEVHFKSRKTTGHPLCDDLARKLCGLFRLQQSEFQSWLFEQAGIFVCLIPLDKPFQVSGNHFGQLQAFPSPSREIRGGSRGAVTFRGELSRLYRIRKLCKVTVLFQSFQAGISSALDYFFERGHFSGVNLSVTSFDLHRVESKGANCFSVQQVFLHVGRLKGPEGRRFLAFHSDSSLPFWNH